MNPAVDAGKRVLAAAHGILKTQPLTAASDDVHAPRPTSCINATTRQDVVD